MSSMTPTPPAQTSQPTPTTQTEPPLSLAIVDTENIFYDITSARNKPLGGTQSSMAFLAEHLAQLSDYRVHLLCRTARNVEERTYMDRGVQCWNIHNMQINAILDIIANKVKANIVLISNPTDAILFYQENADVRMFLWCQHDVNVASVRTHMKEAVNLLDAFIFVSKWQRDAYVKTYGVPMEKTAVLRNAPAPIFYEQEHENTKTVPRLAYTSTPFRGLSLGLEVFELVRKQIPTAEYHVYSSMLLYQSQDTGIFANLLDKAKDTPGVVFHSAVGKEELANDLAKTHVLLYPNYFPETSCISAIEAVTSGCAIVTTSEGALPETISNCSGGLDNHHIFDLPLKQSVRDQLKVSSDYVSRIITSQDLDNGQQFLQSMADACVAAIQRWEQSGHEQQIENSMLTHTWPIRAKQLRNWFAKQLTIAPRRPLLEAVELFKAAQWADSLKMFQWVFDNQSTMIVNRPQLCSEIFLNSGVCNYNIDNLDTALQNWKKGAEFAEQCNHKDALQNCLKNSAAVLMRKNQGPMTIQEKRRIQRELISVLEQMLQLEYSTMLALDLACVFVGSNQIERALATCSSVLLVEPDNARALGIMTALHHYMARATESMKYSDKMIEVMDKTNNAAYAKTLSDSLIGMLYAGRNTIWRASEFGELIGKPYSLEKFADRVITNDTDRKIRVGYLSCDFRVHPCGNVLQSLLENHDPEKFDIYSYAHVVSNGANTSSQDMHTQYLRQLTEERLGGTWRFVQELTDEQLAQQIEDDKIDILIEMMGHTECCRLGALVNKPAPIIVSYFGYPATTGLAAVDYKLVDADLVPTLEDKDVTVVAHNNYTEKLYRLSRGFQPYSPQHGLPNIDPTKNHVFDPNNIVFGCFNNMAKVDEPVIECWAQILNRVPGSTLLLKYRWLSDSFVASDLRRRFEKYGVDPRRLVFGYSSAHYEYLLSYKDIDIALDPFPYNGGLTSSEALHMNTPIITLEGDDYVSRVGVSLLTKLGMGEKWIAKTRQEYVDKVVHLITKEPGEIVQAHALLRAKMQQTVLGNAKMFVQDLEDAYKDMMDRFACLVNKN